MKRHRLRVTSKGFDLDSEDLYKWYFNPAQKVLLARPTNSSDKGTNHFIVKEPDYSNLLNACNLNADRNDYTFNGKNTENGVEFRLDNPDEVKVSDESARLDKYASLMLE